MTAVRAIVAARDVPPDMAFVLDVEFVAEFLVTVFVDSRVVVVGRLLTVGDVMRPVRAITVDAFSDADWLSRLITFVPRDAASAFAMPKKHAIIKSKMLLIYILYNDNKNIFLLKVIFVRNKKIKPSDDGCLIVCGVV